MDSARELHTLCSGGTEASGVIRGFDSSVPMFDPEDINEKEVVRPSVANLTTFGENCGGQARFIARSLSESFLCVVDSSTCDAIEKDAFLRKHFAPNEKRTTTNADMTYTGLYFYGVSTYFEFFDVANSPGHRIGNSGIAFGVDQPGAIRVLQENLGPSLEPSLKSVTRLCQGKSVPWFFMATPKSLPYESKLSCWVMEYHPEFLANWNPQAGGTNRGIFAQGNPQALFRSACAGG